MSDLIVTKEEAESTQGVASSLDPLGTWLPNQGVVALARSLVVAYECIERMKDGWEPDGRFRRGEWWWFRLNTGGKRERMTPEQVVLMAAVMSRG